MTPINSGYRAKLSALAVAGAIAGGLAMTGAAQAKEPAVIPENAEQGAEAGHVIGLSEIELLAFLSESSSEERLHLVAALPAPDVMAVMGALAQSAALPALLAEMVTAALENDPAAPVRIAMAERAPADTLGPVATLLLEDIGDRCHALDAPVLEALVLATLTFDRRRADDLVRLGNRADADCAAQLGTALASISETAEDRIASALELALAFEGGVMLQMVSVLRGEVEVAAIETPTETPAQTPPPAPAVPTAAVGGGGTTPGGTDGSRPGHEAIFAQNRTSGTSGGGTGIGGPGGGGLSLFSSGQSSDDIVSRTN